MEKNKNNDYKLKRRNSETLEPSPLTATQKRQKIPTIYDTQWQGSSLGATEISAVLKQEPAQLQRQASLVRSNSTTDRLLDDSIAKHYEIDANTAEIKLKEYSKIEIQATYMQDNRDLATDLDAYIKANYDEIAPNKYVQAIASKYQPNIKRNTKNEFYITTGVALSDRVANHQDLDNLTNDQLFVDKVGIISLESGAGTHYKGYYLSEKYKIKSDNAMREDEYMKQTTKISGKSLQHVITAALKNREKPHVLFVLEGDTTNEEQILVKDGTDSTYYTQKAFIEGTKAAKHGGTGRDHKQTMAGYVRLDQEKFFTLAVENINKPGLKHNFLSYTSQHGDNTYRGYVVHIPQKYSNKPIEVTKALSEHADETFINKDVKKVYIGYSGDTNFKTSVPAEDLNSVPYVYGFNHEGKGSVPTSSGADQGTAFMRNITNPDAPKHYIKMQTAALNRITTPQEGDGVKLKGKNGQAHARVDHTSTLIFHGYDSQREPMSEHGQTIQFELNHSQPL